MKTMGTCLTGDGEGIIEQRRRKQRNKQRANSNKPADTSMRVKEGWKDTQKAEYDFYSEHRDARAKQKIETFPPQNLYLRSMIL